MTSGGREGVCSLPLFLVHRLLNTCAFWQAGKAEVFGKRWAGILKPYEQKNGGSND